MISLIIGILRFLLLLCCVRGAIAKVYVAGVHMHVLQSPVRAHTLCVRSFVEKRTAIKKKKKLKSESRKSSGASARFNDVQLAGGSPRRHQCPHVQHLFIDMCSSSVSAIVAQLRKPEARGARL